MVNVLKLSEFTKQSDSRVAFDTWRCSRRIDSELGAFALELQTEESLAPDQRMLELANELLEFVRANAPMVGDLVVNQHLEEKRWLRVIRDSACDPHAFRLTIREGRPVELNDSEAALRRLREPAI